MIKMSYSMHARMPVTLFVAMLLAAATAHAQTTWYVDDDAPADPAPGDPAMGDPLEDGSADHPFDAIREGIDASTNGDTVLVADGTYTGDGNRDLDFGGRLITLQSLNGSDNTIIDCEASWGTLHRGFLFHSGETAAATVKGFTIANGAHDGGGGLANFGSSPTVIACAFRDNACTYGEGGAMLNWHNSNPTVTDCTFADNFAGGYDGWIAGISNRNSSPTISRCTFTNNGAGVISNSFNADPIFTDCIFLDNYAGIWNYESNAAFVGCIFEGDSFGAIMSHYSNLTVIDCVFNGNSGGGAIGSYYSSVTVSNCTFSGNRAWGKGGAIGNQSSDLVLVNSTFSANYSPDGMAIGLGPGSTLSIVNSVLWDGGDEIWNNGGSTISITHTDIYGGWPNSSCINSDPLFARPPNDGGDGWGDDPSTPGIDEGANDDYGDLRLL
ncbi:MAG: right-handed parallel beta-helix repeat-containing protein, partial [Planctomycetota bacterium]